MSDRNLNPHAEARVAMIIWSYEYAYEQRGGSMDFWDSRTDGQKQQCAEVVDKILASRRADGTPPQEQMVGNLCARIAGHVERAPPDFADKEDHVEWGSDAYGLMEEALSALAEASPYVDQPKSKRLPLRKATTEGQP